MSGLVRVARLGKRVSWFGPRVARLGELVGGLTPRVARGLTPGVARLGPRVGRLVLLGALAGAVSGCLPAPTTLEGRAVTDLWTQFLIAAGIVGGIVWALMTFALIRYRRRPKDTAVVPPQESGTPRLEIVWTAIPIVIVLALFGLTMVALGRVDARDPSARVTVDVLAYRWTWSFTYAGTGVTIAGTPDEAPELVLPTGEPIRIVLSSADVAHSFYVPAFLFKRDAIPGQPNEFDLNITDAGTYRGQCAEFCGVFHDRMMLSVRAVSRAEFDTWLAAQPRFSAAPGPSGSATGSAAP
ncbi:MAG TPA: cytochrome c oxidase subunit II [Candidatus Limnocylindrales bacterium]